MLFVPPKLLFRFLQYSSIRKKAGNLKWNNCDIMKWSEHITKFNFLKTQKPLLINGSKMVR